MRYTLAEVSTACELLQQAKVKKAATPGEKINNPEGWLTDCLHKKYWCSGATDTTVEVAIAVATAAVEDDWVNDPRFFDWLKKAHSVPGWFQENPEEAEERKKFRVWARSVKAFDTYAEVLRDPS